jgi:hypothetical protein
MHLASPEICTKKLSQDSVSHSIEKSTKVTMSLGSHEIDKSAKEPQCLWVVMTKSAKEPPVSLGCHAIQKSAKGTTLSVCSHAIQKSAK